MSVSPTLPLVSVDEYLNTAYHPDVDYVDGVIEERALPTFLHGLLQLLVANWFRQFEKQFRFKTSVEVRTQIVARARYRIPDVMVCPLPVPKNEAVDVTPLVLVEILSPADTLSHTIARFRDYERIGVEYIIQMDPEECVAHRFKAGSLIETSFESLELSEERGAIPFDSSAIFSQLREEYRDATGEPA